LSSKSDKKPKDGQRKETCGGRARGGGIPLGQSTGKKGTSMRKKMAHNRNGHKYAKNGVR